MTARVALVTGSEPFAGLATNPAQQLLEPLAGHVLTGWRIVTRAMPVSYARLPGLIDALVAELRPALVLSLGLAPGSPVLRLERMALNVADFRVADAEGAAPRAATFSPGRPQALAASWDAPALVARLLDAGIPAVGSWHAGTHLCNLTLYSYLDALARRGLTAPCGFMHLTYTPDQVAAFLREAADGVDTAPTTLRELPSLPLDLQARAACIVLEAMAASVAATEEESRP